MGKGPLYVPSPWVRVSSSPVHSAEANCTLLSLPPTYQSERCIEPQEVSPAPLPIFGLVAAYAAAHVVELRVGDVGYGTIHGMISAAGWLAGCV